MITVIRGCLLLVGLVVGLPTDTPHLPCLGPAVMAPLSPACGRRESWAAPRIRSSSFPCTTLDIFADGSTVVEGWGFDAAAFPHDGRPGLSFDEDCFCRVWQAYPDYVHWEGPHPCRNIP